MRWKQELSFIIRRIIHRRCAESELDEEIRAHLEMETEMTFVFKQTGEKLTGSQSSGSGEQKVTGTVKGNKLEFSVEGKNRSGEPFKNTFTGVIESPIKMSGACEFPKGTGKWTATKK
jgi:hypothetical protein